jgi:hypothetical protein
MTMPDVPLVKDLKLEANIETHAIGISRVSFYVSDELLQLIIDVGGDEAFACPSHAQVVLQQLLALGAQVKLDELEAEAAQGRLFS